MKIFETFQSALPHVDFSMEDRYNKDHGFCCGLFYSCQ